jgi:hypothetical protein
VPREDTAHGRGHALRPLLGAQARSAQAVETPLVQSLVSKPPRQRLARVQLLTADATDFRSRARLHIGKRGRS